MQRSVVAVHPGQTLSTRLRAELNCLELGIVPIDSLGTGVSRAQTELRSQQARLPPAGNAGHAGIPLQVSDFTNQPIALAPLTEIVMGNSGRLSTAPVIVA